MGEVSPERKSGCGLLSVVFGWPKKEQTRNVSQVSNSPAGTTAQQNVGQHNVEIDVREKDRIISRPGNSYTKPRPWQNQGSHHAEIYDHPARSQLPPKVAHGDIGLSGELDRMINDHQGTKDAGRLLRASSGNVMLLSSLGNLRQSGRTETGATANVSGNYVPQNAVNRQRAESEKPASLCRALSTRMDPEQLKIMGNEDYKNGRFAEAVALYDAAISVDPNKASYRSNKSAALTAMGKLIDAAFECREAIRIDPFYQRAHNRLASLYVRLGEVESAVYHFRQGGSDADPDVVNKANKVRAHLEKCTEAKRQRDWSFLLKESSLAIAAGADSAPLIFALKAEALFKLDKHQEAMETVANGPNFSIDDCTKFFGPIGSASLLLIHAQIHLVEGRFDDAVEAAQRASRLDPNNKEASSVCRKTRAVAIARTKGNELFKSARYSEACNAYGEGLNHDPCNAVLLCNRAACLSKLNQFAKAIEDCTSALNTRPAYSKARFRRADCYAKMEKWSACLQDCEVLVRENPDDEELQLIMKKARAELNTSQ